MKLTPQLLLTAYCQGIFPMADEDGEIHWYDPDPRAILPLDQFHVPRRLARRVRHGSFTIRVDHDFRAVMEACATPAPDREQTWISSDLISAYTDLHHHGFAHSVEAWRGDCLVGGLYGVAVRGLFAGESMFSRETDASKVALFYLVERLQRNGFQLLDTQFITGHLARFGAIEVSRLDYQALLIQALAVPAVF